MPDEGDFPNIEFLDPKNHKIIKIRSPRQEEAEAARQREMAVLRHKRIRAEQAPSGSGAPVGHFQQDYRPPMGGPPPRRLSAYDLDMDARRRELDKSIAESLNDPGADWG